MRQKLGVTVILCTLVLSCMRADLDKQGETNLGQSLTSVPVHFPAIPFPEENAFNLDRWQLGKKLFFDPVLSVDGTISCGSCHKQNLAFADDVPVSPGVEGRLANRNAPSLANVAYHPYFMKEGGVPTLEMQALVPIQEHEELAHNIVSIADSLKKRADYVQMSQVAYEREPDPFVITRALATFQRTLISGNSLYDKAEVEKNDLLLNEEARAGKELFFSERTSCFSCHGGFNFTDYRITNNGLYEEYDDPGKYRLTVDSNDLAKFKVPSLRNVSLTAPYMHDGSMATLREVIDHYNSGGSDHFNKDPLIRPLDLTEKEKNDLIAFLKSLTDLTFTQNENFHTP